MRLRFVVAAVVGLVTVALSGCGSTGREAARPHVVAQPVVAPRQSDRVLILANREGSVSVRTATGRVAFRAPFGMAAPDSSTVVQAQPMAGGTRVVASDPLTGVARWTHDVAGTRRVRVVSPGGRFVALVDGNLSGPSDARASTTIDVVTATGTRRLALEANLDPEAFSVDGRYMYALDFLPALNPTRYSVRRIDLRTLHIEAVPDRDGGVRAPMPGYARTQLLSADGRQLYTFYASPEVVHDGDETYSAWVHVLNLDKGWAHCVDLNEKIGVGGNSNPALAESPDGSRLFLTDGTTHAFVAVDTKTLRVVRTRFTTPIATSDAPALLATDGNTLFARDGYIGALSTVDARTLAPVGRKISGLPEISALRMDGSGQALYVLTQSGLLVVDRRGKVVHRWPNPGDAFSIDPSVTTPGSGVYRCAC
jgi:outer membrane protein assembly factor BamB